MANTIYASFPDPGMAEKAAGALLDHGVKAEDLSIVTSHNGEVNVTETRDWSTSSGVETEGTPTAKWDNDNDLKNAGDAGTGWASSAGNKAAEWGDQAAGSVADAFGAEGTAANYRAAAEQNRMESAQDSANAGSQWNDAIDRDRVDAAASTTGSDGVIGSPTYTASNETTYRSDDDTVDNADKTEAGAKQGISTTTPADAGAGAIKGAGWGLGIGAVAALASLFIPGVGLVVGGGALATALGAVAAATGAGAAAGAVTGYLKDQGVDAEVAQRYEETISSGGAMLAVTLPSGDVDEVRAKEVLSKYGAMNVNAYEARSTGGYMA